MNKCFLVQKTIKRCFNTADVYLSESIKDPSFQEVSKSTWMLLTNALTEMQRRVPEDVVLDVAKNDSTRD